MSPTPPKAEEPPQKRPRGRPRKDGRPAGSVPKVAKPANHPYTNLAHPIDGSVIKRGRGRPRKVPLVLTVPAQGNGIDDNTTVAPDASSRTPQKQQKMSDQPKRLEELDVSTDQSEETPKQFCLSQTGGSGQGQKCENFWTTEYEGPNDLKMMTLKDNIARQQLQCKRWAEDRQHRLRAAAGPGAAWGKRWELPKYGVEDEIPKELGQIDKFMFPQLAIVASGPALESEVVEEVPKELCQTDESMFPQWSGKTRKWARELHGVYDERPFWEDTNMQASPSKAAGRRE
ncbi:hypothetical protein Ptr902_12126 [Pyrenophora tritici-repentis]|nr:hypothetical protein Ptr902_12126 [Pyrenophora tritici-repentis]